jgi:acyl-coenzyme A thioesterase PaaI-like protein
VQEAVFRVRAGRLHPTEHARGPWDPEALHGGAPAALIAGAFERHEPIEGVRVARLGFDLLRPIPFAPLRVEVRTVRAGRRVQELSAELHADTGAGEEQLICRATALRLAEVPAGLPELPVGALASETMPGPEAGEPITFALGDADQVSFASTAMEMRWLNDPWRPGPGRVWMRLRHPLVQGEETSALARLAATADFGNGVSASLPFDSYLFINADLSMHLHRAPRGEWIGIDARTLLHEGGTALAESVLHDLDGPVGRAFQALVVAPR